MKVRNIVGTIGYIYTGVMFVLLFHFLHYCTEFSQYYTYGYDMIIVFYIFFLLFTYFYIQDGIIDNGK